MQISSDLGYILFLVDFLSLVIGGGVMMVIWLILTITIPKKLLETYFKEPHFSQIELAFMSIWPGVLFRTVVFAWAVFIPYLHRKRNMLDCYKLMPKWYALSLKAFIVITILTLVIFFGLMGFLFAVGPPIDA